MNLEVKDHFECHGSGSGSHVVSRPDLIGRDDEGTVTVYNVMSGQPRAADESQVKLGMLLLPCSNHSHWMHKSMTGCVLYGDGTGVPIAADATDDEFSDRVASAICRTDLSTKDSTSNIPPSISSPSVQF